MAVCMKVILNPMMVDTSVTLQVDYATGIKSQMVDLLPELDLLHLLFKTVKKTSFLNHGEVFLLDTISARSSNY